MNEAAPILLDSEDYLVLVKSWKQQGDKIIFTNGCFDILHAGHVKYLQESAKLGERLIIGLNDDESVRHLKGENRPINKVEDRAVILASLYMVDMIVIFKGDTPLHLIDKVDPDFLVKGGDYSIEEVVGGELVSKRGKKVLVMSEIKGHSTSKIIEAL